MSIHPSIHSTGTGRTDGKTDGWICRNSILRCMHCMLTRDKTVETLILLPADCRMALGWCQKLLSKVTMAYWYYWYGMV